MGNDERHSGGEFAVIAVPSSACAGAFEDSGKDTRLVGIEVATAVLLIVKKEFHAFTCSIKPMKLSSRKQRQPPALRS